MSETRQIQIRFTENTAHGAYSDALYFPLDAYLNGDIPEEQIILEKSNRVKNWETVLSTPPAEIILSEEEQLANAQAELDNITLQLESITSRKQEILETVETKQTLVSEKLVRLELEAQALLEAPIIEEEVLIRG